MSQKISLMPFAGPLDGSEFLPLVQAGLNVKQYIGLIVAQLAGYITASFTVYAAPAPFGDDTNDGLTNITPKTFQGCLDYFVSEKTLNAGVVGTIQLLDGNYLTVSGIVLPFFYGVQGRVLIRGNASNRNAVVIDHDPSFSGYSLVATGSPGAYAYKIQDLTLKTSVQGFGTMLGMNGGRVFIGDNIEFGTNATGGNDLITCNVGGYCQTELTPNNPIYISANFNRFLYATNPASIINVGNDWTIDCVGGTRNANGAFAFAEVLASMTFFNSAGFIPVNNGSITGVRGNFSGNAVAKFFASSIATFLPGNSPIVTSTGGQTI